MEIKFKLTKDSIQQAINELNNYKDEINHKCEELCARLCTEGYSIADFCTSLSPVGNTITLQSEISPEKAGCKGILTAIGTTTQTQDYHPFNTLLAVEFGAGIRYNNTNQNPLAEEFGMGVGSFPGQTHAFQNVWYYKGNDNKWHPSSGIEATMPMYNATKEMRDKIASIAKEVFAK